MNYQRPLRPLVLAACLGLLAGALLAGCASSSPHPFHQLDDTALLGAARSDLDRSEPERALEKCEALIGRTTARKQREDAELLKAMCRLRMEQYEAAFEDLKSFVNTYQLSKHRVEDPLFAIGIALIDGNDTGFLGIRGFLGLSLEGVEVLRYLIKIGHNGKHAADAQRIIAQFYFDRAEFELAQLEYDAFLADHPKSIWRPLAEYRIPLCQRLRSRGAVYDRRLIEDALKGFQSYERKHPDGDYASLARGRVKELFGMLAEKHYRIGVFYLADLRMDASVFHFQKTLQQYPETRWAKYAVERLREIATGYPDSMAGRNAAAELQRAAG